MTDNLAVLSLHTSVMAAEQEVTFFEFCVFRFTVYKCRILKLPLLVLMASFNEFFNLIILQIFKLLFMRYLDVGV